MIEPPFEKYPGHGITLHQSETVCEAQWLMRGSEAGSRGQYQVVEV